MLAHDLNYIVFALFKCDIKNTQFLKFQLEVICLIKIMFCIMSTKYINLVMNIITINYFVAGSRRKSAFSIGQCDNSTKDGFSRSDTAWRCAQ